MPPVRSISTVDGLHVVMTGGREFHLSEAEMLAQLDSYPGNLKKKEESFNNWLQAQEPFQKTYPIGEYDPDHAVHIDPDHLPPWRIVAGAYVGEITMWIAVHFETLDPLKFTPICQNKEVGPIEGEWW